MVNITISDLNSENQMIDLSEKELEIKGGLLPYLVAAGIGLAILLYSRDAY